jgi:hypothetical protein
MKKLVTIFFVFICIISFAQNPVSVVDVNAGYLIGSASNGKYLDGVHTASYLKGGETYKLYNLNTSVGSAKGSKPEIMDGPCSNTIEIHIDYSPPDDNKIIGIAGNWDAFPKTFKIDTAAPQTYIDITRALIKESGVNPSNFELTQLIVTDLENDGIEEVLINASFYSSQPGFSGEPDNFAVIFLRKIINGKVETFLLNSFFITENIESAITYQYNIAAVLDIDGDGNYEIITTDEFYEGYGISVFGFKKNNIELLLSTGCGL